MHTQTKTNTHLTDKASNVAHYGVVIIFLLAFLETIKDIHAKPLLPFLPLILVLVLLGCVLFLLNERSINFGNLKNPFFIGFNSFGLFILLSTIYSEYPLLTAYRSLQFIFITNGLYIVLSCINDLKKTFKAVGKITIIFTLIASFYGIIIYHFGDYQKIEGVEVKVLSINGLDIIQGMYKGRISSFIGNPNPLGAQIMISILVSFYFLKEHRKWWYALLIVVLAYALLLTGSRASIAGLIGGTAIFISYYYLNRYLKPHITGTTFIGLILVVCGFILFNPHFLEYMSSLIGRGNSTLLNGREIAWNALIEQISETPYFGIGYKVSTETVLKGKSIDLFHGHNLYLSTISEIGIIGFVLFSYIFIWPLIRFLFEKFGKTHDIKVICIALLAAFLIQEFFEDMFSPVRFFFIWVFLSIFIIDKETRFHLTNNKPKI